MRRGDVAVKSLDEVLPLALLARLVFLLAGTRRLSRASGVSPRSCSPQQYPTRSLLLLVALNTFELATLVAFGELLLGN